MDLTRRSALTAAAALAAAPLLRAAPAGAAVPLAEKQAPSYYRYRIGDAQVSVVSDGINTFPLGDGFVLNAMKDEVSEALEAAFLPKDKISIQFAPLVINTSGKVVGSIPAMALAPMLRAKAMSVNSPPTWRLRASTPKRSMSW
jgi:hypothetical protein